MSRSLKVFIYVASWIGAWALFGSIINAGFIAVNLYAEGGKGRIITFLFSGIISIAGAISLSAEVLTTEQDNKTS